MIALTKAQVFLALALSVRAFEPTFSTPRQCESLSISWSSMELPTTIALTEITMTLIPLDSNPAHFAPEPYTLAVPVDGAGAAAGSVSIPSLPFPAGTDFFAQAYIPGMSGPIKRTVSSVMKVEHSVNSDCLIPHPELDKRKAKQFGKRQISVIGANTVASGDLNAAPATTTAAVPINVIGVGQVPANGDSSSAAASTGAAPPVNVIGTQVIPASPTDGSTSLPVNAVPAPSSSVTGPVPAVIVVGTHVVDATPSATDSSSDSAPSATDSASFVPEFSTVDLGQQEATSTDCTTTWPTETAAAEETSTDCTTTTWATETASAAQETTTDCTTTTWATEEPAAAEETTSCTDSEETTTSSFVAPTPTQGLEGESNASSYSNFDDMVNAANGVFHAWNPYKPAYTPSP